MDDLSSTKPHAVALKLKSVIARQSLGFMDLVIDLMLEGVRENPDDCPYFVSVCKSLSIKLAKMVNTRKTNRNSAAYTTFHALLCKRLSSHIGLWCTMSIPRMAGSAKGTDVESIAESLVLPSTKSV